MYAIVATGGKQYKVSENDIVKFERLAGNVGDKVSLDQVLMIGDNGEPKIGRPYVEGAAVECEIVRQDKSRKILVMKKKRRKGFKKSFGHRQCFTEVKISKINS